MDEGQCSVSVCAKLILFSKLHVLLFRFVSAYAFIETSKDLVVASVPTAQKP